MQIVQGLKELDGQIREVLKNDQKVLELAKDLYQQKSLLIMGRGYNFATCMEGSLVSELLVYSPNMNIMSSTHHECSIVPICYLDYVL